MDLVEAMDALWIKWVLQAFEPSECNLKENLKFH